MTVTRGDVYLDTKGRRYRRMTYEQRVQLKQSYRAHVPRWRRSVFGYLLALPLVAAILACTMMVRDWFGFIVFSGSLFILVVVIVALLWGVGPALFALALSALALDYFFVNPSRSFVSQDWRDLLQLVPFVISGLIVALITAQRERARLQALATEQELQSYALELEEINRRLEDANQAKDRFLSIASHELKTPITTIRGQAQLMLRRLSKQKKVVEIEGVETALERINEQTSRLTSLVDELLEVSSIRAGKTSLHRQVCDMRTVCRDVVDDQHLLTGRHIVLTLPEQAVMMNVDCDRLSQVVSNLISNAVKYSPDHAPIEVLLANSEGHVVIKVRDHGKGVPKDQQELIFDTFYRTPDAQSSAKRGLGLGLAISKDIVERHEGRIWCESEPGEGSTFVVELPVDVPSRVK